MFLFIIQFQYKAELIKAFSEATMPLFENGTLKPIVDTEFSFDQIAQAHTHMEANLNIGKIILNVCNDKTDTQSHHSDLWYFVLIKSVPI